MALVVFSSELQQFTGEAACRVEQAIFKDIVDELVARYPKLDEQQLLEMAIAIDGEIIHNPLLERLEPNSELHFMYRIAAG